MMTKREIRKVIDQLKETAFREHAMELSPKATADYLNSMAQERVTKLFDGIFAKFSIADLITAQEILEEQEQPMDRGMN